MLPFLVEGGGALVQAVVVGWGMKEEKCEHPDNNNTEETQKEVKVTWTKVITAPPIFLSATSLVVGGSAWSWYSTTLEAHLLFKHGLNSAQTGLVFLTPAMTYSLASPVVGEMFDHGLSGFKLITTGSGLVTLGFISMGPLSLLKQFSGLWVTVTSMGLQGIGFSFVYIGSLLSMMGELSACGLPESEQSKGMVSSLWTVAVCLGQAMGTTAGGLAWDWAGFEYGMSVEAVIIGISSVLVIGIRHCFGDSSVPMDDEKIELINK